MQGTRCLPNFGLFTEEADVIVNVNVVMAMMVIVVLTYLRLSYCTVFVCAECACKHVWFGSAQPRRRIGIEAARATSLVLLVSVGWVILFKMVVFAIEQCNLVLCRWFSRPG